MNEALSPARIRFLPRVGGTVLVLLFIFSLYFLFSGKLLSGFYYQKANELLSKQEFSNAEYYFQKALRGDPDHPGVLIGLAQSILGPRDFISENQFPQGNMEGALVYYNRAFSSGQKVLAPDITWKQAYDDAGYINFYLKRYDESITIYKRKIDLYPLDAYWARYFVAWNYYSRTNQVDDALRVLTEVPITPFSKNDKEQLFRMHVLFARLYNYKGDYKKAEESAKMALNLVPEKFKKDYNVVIANILLSVLSGRKKDFAEMKKYIQAGEVIDGEGGGLQCYAAYGYFLGGDLKSAIAMGERYYNFQGNTYHNAYCTLAVGNAYLKQDKRSDAKKYFLKYIDDTTQIEPKNAVLIRYREQVVGILQEL